MGDVIGYGYISIWIYGYGMATDVGVRVGGEAPTVVWSTRTHAVLVNGMLTTINAPQEGLQHARGSSASAHTLDGALDGQWIIPAADLKWQTDAYVGDGACVAGQHTSMRRCVEDLLSWVAAAGASCVLV